MSPVKRIICFNLGIILIALLLSFIFAWYIGIIIGIPLLAFINIAFFISKKQYDKLVTHNEQFKKEQESNGNSIIKLTQKEYDTLIKNKVFTKDGQTIYLEDMVNGNKEGK